MKITDKRDEPRTMRVGDMPVGTRFRSINGAREWMKTDARKAGWPILCVNDKGESLGFDLNYEGTIVSPPERKSVALGSLEVGAKFTFFDEPLRPYMKGQSEFGMDTITNIGNGISTQVSPTTKVTPVDVEVVLR